MQIDRCCSFWHLDLYLVLAKQLVSKYSGYKHHLVLQLVIMISILVWVSRTRNWVKASAVKRTCVKLKSWMRAPVFESVYKCRQGPINLCKEQGYFFTATLGNSIKTYHWCLLKCFAWLSDVLVSNYHKINNLALCYTSATSIAVSCQKCVRYTHQKIFNFVIILAFILFMIKNLCNIYIFYEMK